MMRPLLILLLLMLRGILHSQERYDVLITEIMADPSPPNALPSSEWVELMNVSNAPFNLSGWKLIDGSGQSGPMPSFILEPDSMVIICSSTSAAALSSHGRVLAVTSFPSLDNDGELIYLITSAGSILHAVSYSQEWYNNPVKKEGGWTLEMADTERPCLGKENWKASIHPGGGTPGKRNSVSTAVFDDRPPMITHSFVASETEVIIMFDEPLETGAGNLLNFTIDHDRILIHAQLIEPLNNAIKLTLNEAFAAGVIYQVSVTNVRDCAGNSTHAGLLARVGKPGTAMPGDIVINEILFNPRPNAFDYVELLNVGDSVLDASKISIANRSASGAINTIRVITGEPIYIFPGDYVVLTNDPDNLSIHYLVRDPRSVLRIESMPSFPDDEGIVVLLDHQGGVIDEVHYYDDWHFSLISDAEGISLERVDPLGPSNISSNWHSAATTAGYGTPGYRNSQYLQISSGDEGISIEPKIFSPDNDGQDDIAMVNYKVANPGYVANAIIYNAAGQRVRLLARSNLLSLEGHWVWDGLDDKGLALPVGPYILFTEIFHPDGRKKSFKNLLILGRKLR